LTHMILRYFEKDPISKKVESTLIFFLQSFFPKEKQKRMLNEGVIKILENIIQYQLKNNPFIFREDFQDHKVVF